MAPPRAHCAWYNFLSASTPVFCTACGGISDALLRQAGRRRLFGSSAASLLSCCRVATDSEQPRKRAGADTLACFPMRDEDPFIIEQCPHVFFAGNQPEYGATTMAGADKQKVYGSRAASVQSLPRPRKTRVFLLPPPLAAVSAQQRRARW